jgi:hypothetical protein
MSSHQFSPGQASAHPQMLSALTAASESYNIVASQDIVDTNGMKLWGRGQPVSAALQQRLLERKLRHPIESCLIAENGVTLFSLADEAQRALEEDTSIARALRPHAAKLMSSLKELPLHSVAQLLLTTAMATRPQTFPHAVRAMLLAGALGLRMPALAEQRLAMLAGLLHDIGEVYIQPDYLDDASKVLDLLGHKHLVVHPRVAHMLLDTTTDYPVSLGIAIGEHHERQDGSGYPARSRGQQLSSLGKLLAVVETTLGIAQRRTSPLRCAALALRMIPGEYDAQWADTIHNMAEKAQEDWPPAAPAAEVVQSLKQMHERLTRFEAAARATLGQALEPRERLILQQALERVLGLRHAWNSLGAWGLSEEEFSERELLELDVGQRELGVRLRGLQRECVLLAEPLPQPQREHLAPLWDGFL